MTSASKSVLVERTEIYSGRIVQVIVDKLEIAGEPAVREVVRHPGGVVVLAELPDGRIPFVRQLRYPMQEYLLELPAGKVDPGEAPEITAARELEEETGFRPESLRPVMNFYVSPGYCDELLHLYYTDRLIPTVARPDHEEELELEFYALEEAVQLCLSGEIRDAKTVAALFWMDREKRKS